MSTLPTAEIKADSSSIRLEATLQKLGASAKSEMVVFEVGADGLVTETSKKLSITDLLDKVKNLHSKTSKQEIQLIFAIANLARNIGIQLTSKDLESLTGLNDVQGYILASCLPPKVIEKLGGMQTCRSLLDDEVVSALYSSKSKAEATVLLSAVLNYAIRLKPNGGLGSSFELELVNIGNNNVEQASKNDPMRLSINTDVSNIKVYAKTRKIMSKSGLEADDRIDREDEGFKKGKRSWGRLIEICSEVRERLENELEIYWYPIKGRETRALWFHKGTALDPDRKDTQYDIRNSRKSLYAKVKKIWNKNEKLISEVREQLNPENREKKEPKTEEASVVDALQHASKLSANIAEKDEIIRKLASKVDLSTVGLEPNEMEMVKDLIGEIVEEIVEAETKSA